MKIAAAVLCMVTVYCVSCSVPADQSQEQAALATKVSTLQSRIDSLTTQTDALAKSVDLLRNDANRYQTIFLNTGDKGYNRLDTTEGTFLIALANVEPYADGYKLKLEIGNPFTATYSGFAINATWGAHNQTISYPQKLLPATWNSIFLILTPAQKEDLAFITISLSTQTVSLTPQQVDMRTARIRKAHSRMR
jgi:outer membrane murein-binding lipoprotein Lpp